MKKKHRLVWLDNRTSDMIDEASHCLAGVDGDQEHAFSASHKFDGRPAARCQLTVASPDVSTLDVQVMRGRYFLQSQRASRISRLDGDFFAQIVRQAAHAHTDDLVRRGEIQRTEE